MTNEKTAWNVLRDRGGLPAIGDVLEMFGPEDEPSQWVRVTAWVEDEEGLSPEVDYLDGPPEQAA